MKNGAPKQAVIIPTGISFVKVLVSVSDQMRRIAPARAAAGKRKRWSGPTIRRITCGVIRPTNPIDPATATAIPATNALRARRICFYRSTFTPRWVASSSLRERMLTSRAKR